MLGPEDLSTRGLGWPSALSLKLGNERLFMPLFMHVFSGFKVWARESTFYAQSGIVSLFVTLPGTLCFASFNLET